MFRLNPSDPLGYYGHPNPLRGEFVLNRGDADVDNAVYNGVAADINYRGDAFDFENNPDEIDRMIAAVNASGATVCLVGLGGGRQETVYIIYN